VREADAVRNIVRAAIVALILSVGFAGAADAGVFEDAAVAADSGDFDTAFSLLHPLAEKGNVHAQGIIGAMHAYGQGIPQNYVEAVKWWTLAAQQGSESAAYSLGVMYTQGWGVPQDYAKAVEWYRVASLKNFASAEANLGFMYDQGWGIPQSFVEAAKWYLRAAKQGDISGQGNLGILYELGNGVTQDFVQAHMWLNLAASQGDKDAAKNRDRVAGMMTPAQIAEAQKLAREWKPTK